jgi:hypothetical protein
VPIIRYICLVGSLLLGMLFLLGDQHGFPENGEPAADGKASKTEERCPAGSRSHRGCGERSPDVHGDVSTAVMVGSSIVNQASTSQVDHDRPLSVDDHHRRGDQGVPA